MHAIASPRPPAFDGYALDLDGTVYLGDELLPGAAEAIAAIRARGGRVVFATNKPLERAEDYAAKLTALGVPACAEDIVTALDSVIAYLRQRHPSARVMAIAEPVVTRTLVTEGWHVTDDPTRTDVVLVSFDRTFDYAKLTAGYRAVALHGAVIVATNPDPFCPTPDGGLPDCAALLAAFEACTGRRAEAVLGKPSAAMAHAVLERLGLPAVHTAMVGDRLSTDVAMGQAAGMAGVLVLTGATTPEMLATTDVLPDHVLSGLHELLPGTTLTEEQHP
jgi:HAD superfamily hydrolase (TIGR01450 family)